MSRLSRPLSLKNYCLVIVAALLCMAIVGALGAAWSRPLTGDLARLGHLPEVEFGPRQTPPPIPEQWRINSAFAKADVLVIGDSFSIGQIWQSRLQAHGLRTATVHWDLLEACTGAPDFGSHLARLIRESGFKGRQIIIESVERSLEGRMQLSCEPTAAPAAPLQLIKTNALEQQQGVLGWDWVYKALWHTLRLKQQPQDVTFQHTRVVAMVDGCQQFSHRRCEYGLFYRNDFQKPTFEGAPQLAAIDQRLREAGLQPLWLVMPDKSSVYLPAGYGQQHRYVDPWQAIKALPGVHQLDLGPLLREARLTQRDLYLPDDTHLSREGFNLVGEAVWRALTSNNAQPAN
ncbi:alginate O-acetyltransferase AlgX-related protein [Chitinimonas sp.]|uniref:alginate O-acetyltransferase AlgX-related protein n=1 Tax=Chitinimonas sp. TaxID=1934313 RepID=UPI002F95F825